MPSLSETVVTMTRIKPSNGPYNCANLARVHILKLTHIRPEANI